MSKQTKTCSKCAVTKALDAFSRNKSKRDGRESQCKTCRAAYRAEHRDKIAERKAAYYAANRDRVLARQSAYHAANPHVMWASLYRERARRFNLELVIEEFTRDDVIARYGDHCAYCGWGDFERLDHYLPVRAGGPHTLDNARPACEACDRGKFVTPGPDYEARLLEQSKARHPAMGGAS